MTVVKTMNNVLTLKILYISSVSDVMMMSHVALMSLLHVHVFIISMT